MGRRRKPLGTIWEVPEVLWRRLEPILRAFWPRKATGRRVADWRAALNGIIFRLRSGCQWEKLPRRFGPKSTVHGWFQRWNEGGVMARILALLVAECDDLGGVEWKWQAADAAMAKARFGGDGVGPNPTDRAKPGTKRSAVVDGSGGPLGAVVAGANVNDHLILEATIEAVVVERPDPKEVEQHLCLDAGYDNPTGHGVAERHGYVGHIRPVAEDRRGSRRPGRRKARRWVVERTMAWLSKCRAILVRYDKKSSNYLGLIQLASALLWFRRLHRLGVT